ncbi:MAG: TetR/AcrR family transcriptional regulator [Micropepsaceae bacterium]
MPKIVDHDARRQLIARAVLNVVAREGVRGVTIRHVAGEGDWSVGVLSHYFEDKQALLVAALREATGTVSARMHATASIRNSCERIRALLEAGMPLDAERVATCRIFYYFQAEGVVDEDLSQELARNYAAWRSAVRKAVVASQAVGLFAAHEPGALAESLVGLAEGLGVQSMFDPRTMTSARLRQRLSRVIDHLAGDASSGARVEAAVGRRAPADRRST